MNERTRDHGHGHGHGPIEGRASRRYDLMARYFMRRVYRRLAADVTAAAPADGAVLDIGTGPGVLLMELARSRPDLKLTGVDVSADMIDAARRNLGDTAAVRTADVAALPFDPESFDVVVASFTAHHWDDPLAGAAEIARVLRPGGRMLVYDFDRAPYEALARPDRFGHVSRVRFRTGLGRFLRCERFEAVVTPTA
ncbi:class I SAM-dependent methyltransferase [Glycomyces tarimensis]